MNKVKIRATKVLVLYGEVEVDYRKYRVYPSGFVTCVFLDDGDGEEYERECYDHEVHCGITYEMIQKAGLAVLDNTLFKEEFINKVSEEVQ